MTPFTIAPDARQQLIDTADLAARVMPGESTLDPTHIEYDNGTDETTVTVIEVSSNATPEGALIDLCLREHGHIADKAADTLALSSSFVLPAGFLRQLTREDYQRLFGLTYDEVCPYTDAQLLERVARFGEIDAKALLEFRRHGDVVVETGDGDRSVGVAQACDDVGEHLGGVAGGIAVHAGVEVHGGAGDFDLLTNEATQHGGDGGRRRVQ